MNIERWTITSAKQEHPNQLDDIEKRLSSVPVASPKINEQNYTSRTYLKILMRVDHKDLEFSVGFASCRFLTILINSRDY